MSTSGPFLYNGRYYLVVNSAVTWTEAFNASAAMMYNGLQGHLVTITSQAENDFVAGLLTQHVTTGWNNNSIWIGASDAAQEGVWRWVAGPEAGTQFWQGNSIGQGTGALYSNWTGGEPNDVNSSSGYSGVFSNPDGTGSDYGYMLGLVMGSDWGLIGKWDDIPSSTTASSTLSSPIASSDGVRNAYIVEFSGAAVSIAGASVHKAEGNSGTTAYTFTATRTGDTSTAQTANWSVTGGGTNAANAADFAGGTLPNGTVSFDIGETSKTITIEVAGDTSVENDEGFTITLSAPSAGLVLGTATAAGTIINDDTVVQVIDMEVLSRHNFGAFGNKSSIDAGFSRDGSKVVFQSDADNFVDSDINDATDVFIKNLTDGSFALVSQSENGLRGDGPSFDAQFSPNGNSVVFSSYSSSIKSVGINHPYSSIFIKNLIDASVYHVDSASGGGSGNNGSTFAQFSPLGDSVAFESFSSNLVPDDVLGHGIYKKDLVSGNTEALSIAGSGLQGAPKLSHIPVFSPDGLSLVFTSAASNLVESDTNQSYDVYLRRLTNGSIVRLSTSSDGEQANGSSQREPPGVNDWTAWKPAFSPDGSKVAFYSAASNLVPNDTNGVVDLFVKDLNSGSMVRVSIGLDGQEANGGSFAPFFSPDGTKIAFHSSASNLTIGDSNGFDDIFVKDLIGGSISKISAGTGGAGANGHSRNAHFSPDGAKIMFESEASNIVLGDGNNAWDIFLATLSQSFGGANWLWISPPSASKAEGNSGTTAYTFTATRTGDTSTAQTANWSVTGSGTNAANAADFQGGVLPSDTLTFEIGQTSKTITVFVQGDITQEADEGFTVTLSTPSAGLVLGTSTASGTIINDDASVSIAAASASKAEGNSGTTAYTFTATRTGDTSTAQTANWAVTGSGTNAAIATDFVGGTLPSDAVTFGIGETSKTITVNVAGDTSVENNEGFTVTLSAPSTGLVLGTSTAAGTIINDDASVSIAAASASKTEGNSGTTAYTFTATRTGDTSTAQTVAWAVTGSGTNAANATDFQGGVLPIGTVSFGIGVTSQTITVFVQGDTTQEADEGFTVTLSAPSTGLVIGTATATGNIINDDQPLGTDNNDTLIGTPQADTLEGLGGNDSLVGLASDDRLDGGTGADTMWGGEGNDVYAVDNTGDSITELSRSGSDRVESSISYSLGAELESLLLTGAAHTNGVGNSFSNQITGNSGNNSIEGGLGEDTLLGGAGADTLLGGAGNDQLTGGSGNDVFRFTNYADSGDIIRDFVRGEDRINLSAIDANATLAGDQAFEFRGVKDSFAFSPPSGDLLFGITATKATVVYSYNLYSDTTTIEIDSTDARTDADMVIYLAGRVALQASDFVL